MELSAKLIRCKKGFTLVELIVVITVISVITVASLPGFIAALRRAQFEKTVNGVVALLEKARTQALASELDSAQKITTGGYGVFFDFTSESTPTDQKVVLFADNWNNDPNNDGNFADGKPVNLNYGDADIANRVLPDGIYTPGKDSALTTIAINDPAYVQLTGLRGQKLLNGLSWDSLAGNTITTIFKPPYADATILGNGITPLQNFEAEFKLMTESSTRTIKFNRVTTATQVIKN
ncbi:MAG: prepilin-type N-terminal cleavage/methylation domain-containing protein [Patescibacteria group bacterium]